MSDQEVELKAGHAPALKVGGARVVTRHKSTSVSEDPRPLEEEVVEDEEATKEPKEKAPQLVMWGQVRDPAKDYPSEAIQHMQNKPQPTRSAAETKPKTHNIQQPRKC